MDSATQELRQRAKDQQPTPQDNDINTKTRTQKSQPSSVPRRGMRSLAIGIMVPLILTLANVALFGWNRAYRAIDKPFWVPPLWALHLTCISSSFVMGLSAWLVWAEGGFHENPSAMGVYLSQLGLSLAWDPVFFKMEAARTGLLVCLGQLASLFYCYKMFGRVNRTAGDLVKLCLVWSGFLTLVNFCCLIHLYI